MPGPEIDDLDLHAILCKLVRRFERWCQHRSIGHECDVVAFSVRRRDTDGYDLVALGHGAFRPTIQVLVLTKHDGIVVANSRLQEPLRVVRGCRGYHLQPCAVYEPGFRILRVIPAATDVPGAPCANDNRHRCATAVAISQRGGLIDNLVEPRADEVRELHLGTP